MTIEMIKQSDCDACGVSQKQIGDLCAGCHSNRQLNDRIRRQQDEFEICFWARALAWAFCALLCAAMLLLIVLLK